MKVLIATTLVTLLSGFQIQAQQLPPQPPQRLPGVTDMARKPNPQDFLKDHFEFVMSLLDHKIQTVPASKVSGSKTLLKGSPAKADLKPTGGASASGRSRKII
jgi:hypothetical protein